MERGGVAAPPRAGRWGGVGQELTPATLREFEPGSETQLSDSSDGLAGVSRRIHRLRESALAAIIQGIASGRLSRALNSRTRPAG
eukprot:7317674-Pyramimonas_sp.AAC.1